MRHTGFFFSFLLSILISFQLIGQSTEGYPDWVVAMYKPNADIAIVLDLYDKHYLEHPFEKNQHTQYLKRWIRNISRDITGQYNNNLNQRQRDQIRINLDQYANKTRSTRRQSGNSWTGIGPFDWDHEAASKSYAPGAAHMYTIEQASSDPDILYAGAATGGLWKSTDHGQNWEGLTLDLMENRVYALDIHPSNPSIVFADLLDNIYRTTDGGSNWQTTGDAGFQALTMDVLDLKFHPTEPDIIFAATSLGLYRTDDQGDNWSLILPNKIQEIEIHPGNDSIIYIIQQTGDITKFYRSTDIGLSFQHQSTGWPVPTNPDHNRRAEIAVSPDAPDKVFALLTGSVNGGSGLYGIYTSDDMGSSWTFSCCGPQPGGFPDLNTSPPNINMMGWSDQGTDNGGQFYYDLALAVSPSDADSVFVGGVNLWISGDGGNSFTCPAKWSHSNKPNYVHADIHDINYYANGELWIACDGGIFFSDDNAVNISRRMYGIEGSDFWGFGASFWSGEVMLGGAYHNGTLLKNDSFYINGWHCVDGGDGTGGFVNVGNDKRVYSNFNIKDLPDDRETPIPTRGYAKKPFTHYIVGRSSNIAFHPFEYHTQYFGSGECLYVTRDDNYSVDTVFCFGADVADVEISWVNPDYIYLATFPGHWTEKKIYRSTDAGQTWTDITPSSSVFSSNRWIPYDLTLSDTDPDVLWIARVANSVASYDGQKVYKTADGGQSWINLTTAELDGEQLTNIVYQRGSNDGLWIGTRRAVYYRSNNLGDWMLCNDDLPASTFSTRLVINYRTQKIRNATNRSVYEMPLIESSIPLARLSVDKTYSACSRDTFYFSDYSNISETGASWNWSFPGATWVSAYDSRNPKVIYGITGTYDVSLIVGDVNGSDTVIHNGFITASNYCDPDSFPGKTLLCQSVGDYATFDLDIQTNTLTVTAWIKPDGIQPEYSAIFMGGDSPAGFNFRNFDNTLAYHWPGGQWWWDSQHKVPQDEWSFVAMVASPEAMTLYLNGIGDQHNVSLSPVNYNTAHIGSYFGWNSRNYKGEIEEMTIWNRSLSTEEIRELMHITRDKIIRSGNPDTSLLTYYQFNEVNGNIAYDRAGLRHAVMQNGAIRANSTAPVGGGHASTQDISSTGHYLFTDENAGISIDQSTGLPNGPVVVSRIDWPPNNQPDFPTINNRYWIVHSFGTNNQMIIDSLFFYDPDLVHTDCHDHFLFKRNFNEEGNSWGELIGINEACDSTQLYFPDDTLQSSAQYCIGHYDGNFYVDEHSMGGNGGSWETAYKQLQSAVDLAAEADTIFVAEGLYRPASYPRDCDNCTNDRQFSIHPRSGTTLLGGFQTRGGDLQSRDWLFHPTIISGQLTEDTLENVYHVVYIDSLAENIKIDGFYIRDGRADGAGVRDKSGGALLCHGQVQLDSMYYTGNYGDSSLIHLSGPSCDVIMIKNMADENNGGALILDVDNGARLLLDEESEFRE